MIASERLDLRPGAPATYEIAFDDRASLAAALGVRVPDSWPVDHYDADVLAQLRASTNGDTLYYVVERATNTLIGTFGSFKVDDETQMIGYSVLPEFRRRGFATEALRAFIAQSRVPRLVAYTFPHLVASIGVLEKCGFRRAGDGAEEGTIRFERLC